MYNDYTHTRSHNLTESQALYSRFSSPLRDLLVTVDLLDPTDPLDPE